MTKQEQLDNLLVALTYVAFTCGWECERAAEIRAKMERIHGKPIHFEVKL